MSLSKIISADNPKQADIKQIDFYDLKQPLPDRSRAGKDFRAADFFRETGLATPEERFVASFGREAAKSRAAEEEALAAEQARAELEAQREEPPPPPTPEELLDQARAEAEVIRAEAAEQGRMAGYEEGLAEAREQTAQAAAGLLEAAAEIRSYREGVFQGAREDVIELVIAATRATAARNLALDPEAVVDLVASGLKHIGPAKTVKILLNPEDLALVDEHKDQLTLEHHNLEELDLNPDPDAPRGGCRIVTETMEIDASLEGRLQSLTELFSRTLRSGVHAD